MATTKAPVDPRELAMATQLAVEIRRSQWRKVTAFHRALADAGIHMDYSNLTKVLRGQAILRFDVLLILLDFLGVNLPAFVAEAMAHSDSERTDAA